MISIPGLFVTVILQFLLGLGTLGLFRAPLRRSWSVPLAMIIGMYGHTVALLLCDVFALPINGTVSTGALFVATVLVHAYWPRVRPWYGDLVNKPWKPTIRLYDLPTFAMLAYIMYIPLWASWYWPVTPFDAMAGIDLVARQTLVDQRIDNAVFYDPSLEGFLSNQPFYAPFAMLMQVIIRALGVQMGQAWLGVLAVAHVSFLWMVLRSYIKPFVANIVVLLLVMVPEVHGYMYLLQTDFANSVFMTAGVVLMAAGMQSSDKRFLFTSAVFFAAACWSRSETILLVGLGCCAMLPLMWKEFGRRIALQVVAVIGSASAASFALWHGLYYYVILPVKPNVQAEVNEVSVGVFDVLWRLILVANDPAIWGATFILIPLLIVLSFIASYANAWPLSLGTGRYGNTTIAVWFVAIALGLIATGALFSSAIVEQTLRRGIFKLIPLMYLLVATTPLLQRSAQALESWEERKRR
ncbi:MAG: hypothetical protein MUC47_02245 [Candidatus Kapabacteria bacterium]|nr:hypothetical protein [Candidatus Kapabacteria bacterium]